ncbi:MAG: acetate kinase, partial [Flavisolibacter sp.]
DMRDILKAIEKGDTEARLAYDLYAYRIKKYIGSLSAVMNGLDALVFTAGVGENDSRIRLLVCGDMDFFQIQIDEEKNAQRSKQLQEISGVGSRVRILVIPTNEELEIVKQCYALLQG